jgi:hypothetical protein
LYHFSDCFKSMCTTWFVKERNTDLERWGVIIILFSFVFNSILNWGAVVVVSSMVVGFITTYAISAHHHWSSEIKFRSWRGLLDKNYLITFVSDLRQVGGFCQVLRFPPQIKLTHDITKILLKVAFNTIPPSSIVHN